MTILMVPRAGDIEYPSLGPHVCDFIEQYLVFGPGDLRGEPAFLDDEKRALIWRIYELYPKDHRMEGRRRFKRVALMLQKGTAKTEMAAWIAACELHPDAPVRFAGWGKDGPIGKGVTDPYIPIVAFTEEQSEELCYGTLRIILEEGPLKDDFDIGLERIMRKRGDGKAVALSTSPNARDGARTSFSVADEVHWWTLPRLKQAHQTMLANIPKRKGADAWTLETTTAPEPGAGSVAEATLDYAKAVDVGQLTDSRLFFFYRYASDDHNLDTEAGARAAVIEAAGPTAPWRDIDSIVELWRDPTTDRSYWERVWLNRMVKASRQGFDFKKWQELTAPREVPDGELITLGFDGALFHDATGLVATHVETGYQWVLGVWECPYGQTDWQVPEQEVDDAVTAAFERWDVWRLYADPPYWQSWIAKWAGDYPDQVIEWHTNRRKQMTAALENYDTAIKTGLLSHDGNDVFGRHIANSYRHDLPNRDEQGHPLWLIRKERSDSPSKIDIAMAAVLSWEARTDAIMAGAQTAGEAGIFTL